MRLGPALAHFCLGVSISSAPSWNLPGSFPLLHSGESVKQNAPDPTSVSYRLHPKFSDAGQAASVPPPHPVYNLPGSGRWACRVDVLPLEEIGVILSLPSLPGHLPGRQRGRGTRGEQVALKTPIIHSFNKPLSASPQTRALHIHLVPSQLSTEHMGKLRLLGGKTHAPNP